MSASPDVPKVTDPNIVASNQQDINTKAAKSSQVGSMVNQNTAYGSLNYNQSGTSPDGTPLYTATTSFNPEQQNLLNILNGTKTSAGIGASKLISGANYGAQQPGDVIGNATSGLVKDAMGKQVAYLQPGFDYDSDRLDTKLKNQGFAPGQPGYDKAMNALKQSQGQTVTGFESTIEPQMFNQATQSYLMPASLGGTLANFGSPTAPTFAQTPQLNIQPADLTGATANANSANMAAYNAQLAQNQAMMKGLFGIGTTALGVMGAPFTGGLSLGLLGAGGLGGVPGTSIGGSNGPTSYGGPLGAQPLV